MKTIDLLSGVLLCRVLRLLEQEGAQTIGRITTYFHTSCSSNFDFYSSHFYFVIEIIPCTVVVHLHLQLF